jgi:DnaK suppressor protein
MFLAKEADTNRVYMDRLVNRRDRIRARIDKLHSELIELERHALLHKEGFEQQRKSLLSYLFNFHQREIEQVDGALQRMARGRYAVCLACNNVIEPDWLDSFPEAEFCSTCHRMKESTGTGSKAVP